MNKSDNINFRGKFRQYDPEGKPYLYLIGDAVEYGSKRYVAVRPTSSSVPGSQEAKNIWKELSGNQGFYIQEPPSPVNVNIGDRWYVPSTEILYTYVQEESNKFWVEL
jgi:hypothetical protein